MKNLILLFFTLSLSVTTAAQQININLEIAAAQSVTALLSGKKTTDVQLEALAKLYGSQQLIEKVKGYSGQGEDIFKSTLKEMVQTGTVKGDDPYNWKTVKAKLPAIKKLLTTIAANKPAFTDEVANLIKPFTPTTLKLNVRACFLVGGGSLGFTVGNDDTFNVALQAIGDDLEGLKMLIAHELYHSIQGAGQKSRKKDTAEKPTYNEKATYAILYNLWSEGSANFVGDFQKIKAPGAFSKEQLALDQKNGKRMQTSFTLLETVLFRAFKDPKVSYSQLYNIGFTTEFEEVFYAVGYEMAKQIASQKGDAAIADLVTTDPILFIQQYIALYKENKDSKVIRFGEGTEQIVSDLMKWKDRI